MFCITIAESDLKSIEKKLKDAVAFTDLVEIRGDYFEKVSKKELVELLGNFNCKYIFTFRSKKEGGKKRVSAEKQLEWIEWALAQDVFYLVDLEYELALKVKSLRKFKKFAPKLLVSYHDFKKVPSLTKLLEVINFTKKLSSSYCKLVCMVRSFSETLKLLYLIPEAKAKGIKLISFGMGEAGKLSRVLSLLAGSPFTYVVLKEEEAVAPGQLSLKKAKELYESLKSFTGG